ncbi:uncharacterized protein LOC128756375 isoform X2 [Synchiropus splendidus]|uniref:uncharacterized protein LOC128756375 isoform X2 n=1 Tax=Synchiropus splendidus TaxID=270530 RepID=UPI00237E29E0|nr:uncharacterized protein LOC128756375 isoform X2 [Synchiropus splendidus]
MSQSSKNPYVWLNPNREPYCQPTSQSHQLLGPGSNHGRSMGLSVTFGVSGGLIQSREPRITCPQEQLHCVNLSNIGSQIEKDDKSSLEGLIALTRKDVVDDGLEGKWVGLGEAHQTEVKIKLEEEAQTIMDAVESAHDPELRIKVEKTEDAEEVVSSFCEWTVDSKSSLSGLREDKSLLGPEQITQKVFSSSSNIPVQISIRSEAATHSREYPGHTARPQVPLAASHSMMRPTWFPAPRRFPRLPPPFPKPRHFRAWHQQSAPWAFVRPVNRYTTFPVVRTASNIERPKLKQTAECKTTENKTTQNNTMVSEATEKILMEKKKTEENMTKKKKKKKKKMENTEEAVSSELQTVWQMTKIKQFGQKLGPLCLKRKKTKTLNHFLKLGVSNLLIDQLPRCKPDDELMSYLHSTLQAYLPPEWLLEFYYIMEVGVVSAQVTVSDRLLQVYFPFAAFQAIVALPPGKFARDILQCSDMKAYQGKTFPMRVLKENLGSSPLMFFRGMMEIIDKAAAINGGKTVFFKTITEEEVAELKNTFRNRQAVQYFMPLHGKLFIEFSTLEDADQFGLQLSQRNLQVGKAIYRLGFTSCGVMECSDSPFWVTIPMHPFLFPTVTSSFVIPEHKTVRSMADIEAVVSRGDCGKFRTVMFTNLPQECNAHCAIKKVVQFHLTKVTPQFDNYCIIVLPLQRRAFVHFEDWESCSSCLRDFIQNPKFCLHLVTQSMCPQFDEDTMYQSLMALSNTPVHDPHSLSERLLVVSVDVDIVFKEKDIHEVVDKVTSVRPFASFLPLGNRICIEMVNSDDAIQLVENYRTMSFPPKYAMWPITNFESCQDMAKRMKGLRSEAHEVEPARADVMAPVNTPAGAAESPILEVQELELDIDGEEVEYQMIDSVAGETSVTTMRQSSSNWDSNASSISAPDTKEESVNVEHKELLLLIDEGDKDPAHDGGIEISGSARTRVMKRSPVLFEKRKSEMAGPQAKRSCPPPPCDTAAFRLPAFTPNNPLGQEFIHLRSGFSCSLCSVFVLSKSTVEEHCCSQMHHANLKNYYLKLQHMNEEEDRLACPSTR